MTEEDSHVRSGCFRPAVAQNGLRCDLEFNPTQEKSGIPFGKIKEEVM